MRDATPPSPPSGASEITRGRGALRAARDDLKERAKDLALQVDAALALVPQSADGVELAAADGAADLRSVAGNRALAPLPARFVSESSISIKDDRLELAALLYDQAGVQKVIDRLSAVKALLPENASSPEKKEAAVDGKGPVPEIAGLPAFDSPK